MTSTRTASRTGLAALALAAALAVAGSANAQPRTMLNVGMAAQDISRLDPHYSTTTIDKVVVGWMFSGLVRFRPGSISPAEIEPDLAERWESSPDGKTWTFHLRRGVQFHRNFGEVTAEDIVFSLTKAADARRSGFAADYRAFEAVEVVDPYTVRIRLKEVVPSLLGLVTNYHGGNIVSRRAVEQLGDRFLREPVGTGPFQVTEHRARQSLELAAHEGYFRGRPQIQRVSYRFIPSDASRDLAYQNGEIDLIYGRQDQSWANRMKALPNTSVMVFDPAELGLLHMNITRAPLNDIRVRQAIAHAANREELIQFHGVDVSRAGTGLLPRGYLGGIEVGAVPHNIERARQLLREAGFPNGLTIKTITTQLPSMLATMQVVQAQLRRAGITLDMEVVEHATFHAQIRQDLSPIVFYSAARFPVADTWLTQMFHSRSIVKTPTAVTNFSHCGMADAEIDAARVETNPQRQLELWATAQRKLAEAVCAVPLREGLQIWARRNSVELGYQLNGAMSLGPLLTEQTRFR
ncbi:MAG: polyamine ABC transporter substrate-binding protein [Alphaproteobacteria bacterium]|nr:polyamine ABC transporter substrate-binding protein [Alphaproteobacteria bacterium]